MSGDGFSKRTRKVNHSVTIDTACKTHGGLLDDNVLDGKVLQLKVLGISVRLGVLQETSDELDALLGPPT